MTLMMTDKDTDAVADATMRAMANPVPWAVLQHYLTEPDPKGNIIHRDDPKCLAREQTETVEFPSGHRLNVTAEEQPAGICLHLSMSTPNPKETLPSRETMLFFTGLAVGACGSAKKPRAEDIRMWIEDYTNGDEVVGRALNVIVLVKPAEKPAKGEMH